MGRAGTLGSPTSAAPRVSRTPWFGVGEVRAAARARPWQWLLREPRFSVLTAAVDLILAAFAVVLTGLWASYIGLDQSITLAHWAFPILTVGFFWVRGLYRRRMRAMFLEELGQLLAATALAGMSLLTLLLAVGEHAPSASLAARLWLISVGLLGLGRYGRVLVQRHARAFRDARVPTLVVGAGLVGHHVARRLEEHPEYGLRAVGFLDATPLANIDAKADVPVLGHPDDLSEVADATGAEHVIVAFSSHSDRQLLRVARTCHAKGLQISVVPRLFDATNQRVTLDHLGGLPLFNLRAVNPRGWQFSAKHAFDRTAAALAIFVFSPLLLIIAALVKCSSPGPILYRQRRVGRDGQVFDVLKFRSMAPAASEDPEGFELRAGVAPGGVEGEDRRTTVGRWLRRTSLDELPQLFNVVRGEMSLIGPRPERPEFVHLFQQQIERYGERHRVKAGITGWSQVNGLRGQTSIADRAEWDNYYIENWSLKLDLQILVLTLLALRHRTEDT